MLNSGKKYSNSRVVRKKMSERNTKPYPPPPLHVKWSVPKDLKLGWRILLMDEPMLCMRFALLW